ncbi:MAG: hypothetical protein COT38_04885, partial [Candidatus Omnitrophica bacterium CG08_land_8_20_14_0_20_41_16]
ESADIIFKNFSALSFIFFKSAKVYIFNEVTALQHYCATPRAYMHLALIGIAPVSPRGEIARVCTTVQ